MNSGKIPVTVTRVPEKPDTYIAHFSSSFMGATFSVLFPDSITGALALHGFAEMVRLYYGKPVELVLEHDLFPMKSKAVEDMLASIGEKQPVPM